MGPALAVILFVAGTLVACAAGIALRTELGNSHDLIPGTYTLLLYGCSYPHRIDNAAILVPEAGRHEFTVYGPAFQYKVRKGVHASEAIREAEQFLQCSTYFRKFELRAVLDPAGTAIGYEVRPLYSPVDFGRDDVLTITYRLAADGSVQAFIQLDQDIERKTTGDRGPFLHDRDGSMPGR